MKKEERGKRPRRVGQWGHRNTGTEDIMYSKTSDRRSHTVPVLCQDIAYIIHEKGICEKEKTLQCSFKYIYIFLFIYIFIYNCYNLNKCYVLVPTNGE